MTTYDLNELVRQEFETDALGFAAQLSRRTTNPNAVSTFSYEYEIPEVNDEQAIPRIERGHDRLRLEVGIVTDDHNQTFAGYIARVSDTTLRVPMQAASMLTPPLRRTLYLPGVGHRTLGEVLISDHIQRMPIESLTKRDAQHWYLPREMEAAIEGRGYTGVRMPERQWIPGIWTPRSNESKNPE